MRRALTLAGFMGIGALLAAACGSDEATSSGTAATGGATGTGATNTGATAGTPGSGGSGTPGSGGSTPQGDGSVGTGGGSPGTGGTSGTTDGSAGNLSDTGAGTGGSTGGSGIPASGLLSICTADVDCGGTLGCYNPFGGSGFCTETCTFPGGTCADLGGVTATCVSTNECAVVCTGSGTGDGACPALMECTNHGTMLNPLYRCGYPPDAGTGGGAGSALPGELAPCATSTDCQTGLICYTGAAASTTAKGFCTRSCSADTDCYDHQGVDFTCAPTIGGGGGGGGGGGTGTTGCRVDCGTAGTNGTCPSSMTCIDLLGTGSTMRCLYPPA